MLGKQTETTGDQTASYVRDPYGNLIYKDGPRADDFYYYFDGLGSVIGLVDPSGNQRAKYSYDPFGSHATEAAVNGPLPANPWRWMGGYLDGTGLYHFGERYYDPNLGRFLQVDPVPEGSANAYEYGLGDPVNMSDVNGTWTVSTGRYVLSGGVMCTKWLRLLGKEGGQHQTKQGVCWCNSSLRTADWTSANRCGNSTSSPADQQTRSDLS